MPAIFFMQPDQTIQTLSMFAANVHDNLGGAVHRRRPGLIARFPALATQPPSTSLKTFLRRAHLPRTNALDRRGAVLRRFREEGVDHAHRPTPNARNHARAWCEAWDNSS